MEAEAYLNYGVWKADCPTGDHYSSSLHPGQTEATCGSWDDELQEWLNGCGTTYSIRWPEELAAVNRAFDVRTKDWPVYDDDDEPTGETWTNYSPHYDGQDHARSWNPGQEVPE